MTRPFYVVKPPIGAVEKSQHFDDGNGSSKNVAPPGRLFFGVTF
jgi:hypothetical protein